MSKNKTVIGDLSNKLRVVITLLVVDFCTKLGNNILLSYFHSLSCAHWLSYSPHSNLLSQLIYAAFREAVSRCRNATRPVSGNF